MSEEECLQHLSTLYRESETIRTRFALLMRNLQKDLEKNNKLKDAINLLAYYDRDLKEEIRDCTDFASLFLEIRDFVSFFDYKLLKILAKYLGSSEIKKKLKKYKSHFQEFAKRHICECPSDLFGESETADSAIEKPRRTYVIKIDKSMEKFTLKELENLKCKMNEILGQKFLKVVKVEDGCVQVTFRTFSSSDFVISDEQQRALSSLGVISISCGSESVHIPTLSSLETKAESGEYNPIIMMNYSCGVFLLAMGQDSNDSGFYSESVMTYTNKCK